MLLEVSAAASRPVAVAVAVAVADLVVPGLALAGSLAVVVPGPAGLVQCSKESKTISNVGTNCN